LKITQSPAVVLFPAGVCSTDIAPFQPFTHVIKAVDTFYATNQGTTAILHKPAASANS